MMTAPDCLAYFPGFCPFTGYRFTVDEYHRMGEAGIFREDDRVELKRPAAGTAACCASLQPALPSTGHMERSADWMDQARGDLDHAHHDATGGFHDWACFSAQQAAEKAVKAVFQKLGSEAWGHSVADLLDELGRSRNVPEDLRETALELDKTYIPSRYPNAHASGAPRNRYTRTEADRMVGYAGRIVRFCEDLLAAL